MRSNGAKLPPTHRRLLEVCVDRRSRRSAYCDAKLRTMHGDNALRKLRAAGLLNVEGTYGDDILETTKAGREALAASV
jgi:hypothetical protein